MEALKEWLVHLDWAALGIVLLVSEDVVADPEDVLRIDSPLQGVDRLPALRRGDPVDEAFAELADAVVVGD